jgi:hypothetical protein
MLIIIYDLFARDFAIISIISILTLKPLFAGDKYHSESHVQQPLWYRNLIWTCHLLLSNETL